MADPAARSPTQNLRATVGGPWSVGIGSRFVVRGPFPAVRRSGSVDRSPFGIGGPFPAIRSPRSVGSDPKRKPFFLHYSLGAPENRGFRTLSNSPRSAIRAAPRRRRPASTRAMFFANIHQKNDMVLDPRLTILLNRVKSHTLGSPDGCRGQ